MLLNIVIPDSAYYRDSTNPRTGSKSLKVFFDNGWGVSIITEDVWYDPLMSLWSSIEPVGADDELHTFEVAILQGTLDKWDFSYDNQWVNGNAKRNTWHTLSDMTCEEIEVILTEMEKIE